MAARDTQSSTNPDGRLSRGRLEFIRSYLTRLDADVCRHTLHSDKAAAKAVKFAIDLLDEVHRLRGRLEAIAEGVVVVRTIISEDKDRDHWVNLQASAREAIRDPDMGEPDCVCRDGH